MSTELLDQLETRIGALTDQVMLMKMEIDELKAQHTMLNEENQKLRDERKQWSERLQSLLGKLEQIGADTVTDDKGNLIAYERASGRNLWRQDKLALRGVSGPAVDGNTLVVGDYQGFLHFIDTEDGSFVAQRKTDGGAIETAPQPTGGRWLIQTQKGGLSALTGK